MTRCPDCNMILERCGEQGQRDSAWHVEVYRCQRCLLTVYIETRCERDADSAGEKHGGA